MFTKNPNDCKIKRRKLGQMQQYYVNGRTGSFYQLIDQYKGADRQAFSNYVAGLPEREAEEVLKAIQQDRGERAKV